MTWEWTYKPRVRKPKPETIKCDACSAEFSEGGCVTMDDSNGGAVYPKITGVYCSLECQRLAAEMKGEQWH